MSQYIWFDLGYTLLYINREEAYRRTLSELNVELPLDTIARGFHFTDKLFMREFPGLFGGAPATYMPWFLGRLNYFLGVKLDLVAVMNRWLELRQAQPRQWEAYDFCLGSLKALRADGYSLGVISNWDETARSILDEHGLTEVFDTIVISSEVGCEKPSAEIFKKAFKLSGSGPDQGCYVGDNYYDDAVGSRAVGMDCLIINPFGSFGVEELSDCDIIPDIRMVGPCLEKGR